MFRYLARVLAAGLWLALALGCAVAFCPLVLFVI